VIAPIFLLTLRALMLQRRTLMLALVAASPVLAALVFALANNSPGNVLDFYSGIVQQLFVPTVAALIALVFGVSAFGDEREDGTILYLVATPQSRFQLVIAKVLAAWVATLMLLVPSLGLTGLLGILAVTLVNVYAGLAAFVIGAIGWGGMLQPLWRRHAVARLADLPPATVNPK